MAPQRLLILSLCLAAAFLFSCGQKRFDDAYYETIAQHVSAFTSGDVSRRETIRVRFNQAAVSSDQVGKPLPAGIVKVSPSLDADGVWEDEYTLALKPNRRSKANSATKRR